MAERQIAGSTLPILSRKPEDTEFFKRFHVAILTAPSGRRPSL